MTKTTPPGLLNYHEISDQTGVPVQILRVWYFREKLPPADFTVSGSPVWRAETIQPWIKNVHYEPRK